ncbi:MAG: hypothetical protein LAO19_14925 [Acidobacteriia bacterium]|nr:hypothetical protein [Terriglobia bacterium]
MHRSKFVFAAFLGVISVALAVSAVRVAARQQASPQKEKMAPASGSGQMQGMPGMDHDMPGMDMGQGAGDKDPQAEHGAMDAMSRMHHHQMGPHMYMTKLRPSNSQDWAKGDEIVKELRESIEKYKDYHAALADGFRIFMPNVPQAEYHFTNYYDGYLESFRFDPTLPTSLLYKKTKTGYELIGAMYTMPKRVTEDQLNERIPLSVAQWHLHTKLCMPPKDERGHADLTRFGLTGSIITKESCTDAGGTFYPVIFGWMVHVYPFEDSREKIWGQ